MLHKRKVLESVGFTYGFAFALISHNTAGKGWRVIVLRNIEESLKFWGCYIYCVCLISVRKRMPNTDVDTLLGVSTGNGKQVHVFKELYVLSLLFSFLLISALLVSHSHYKPTCSF